MSQDYPRILCVDDQEDFLLLVHHFLTANQFRVVATPKGEEALRFAMQERFAAAVIDFSMPEMNGEELAIKLRAIDPEMPIVLFSASSHDLPESVFAAVDLTVSKSFPISNLVTVLKRLTAKDPVRRDRRTAVRQPVELEVRILAREVAEQTGIDAADLCRGGVGLRGALPVPVGGQVEIAICSKSGELLLAAIAEVRHVAEQRTGLRFVQMSDQQQAIVAALCQQS